MTDCQHVRSLAVEAGRCEAIDTADAKIDTVSRVVSGHLADLELRSSGGAGGARIALRSGAHQAVRWTLGGNHD